MEWDQEIVGKMHDAGITWKDIGKLFGMNGHDTHRKFDPEFDKRVAAARRMSQKERKERHKRNRSVYDASATFGRNTVSSRKADSDWQRLRNLIPDDTRDLTARLCGDPIPNDPRRAG